MSMVRFSIDQSGVATITLDRDDARNAISNAMAAAILEHLAQAEQQQARVIVLRANPGVRVWCAGHDLSDLDPAALDENLTLEICRRLQASPLPVIAAVEGQVYGGGLLLLLSCDIVVATSDATVALTAGKLGIPLDPGWCALLLSAVGLHRAKELLLTAAPISAEAAFRAGLFNRLVSGEELASETSAIAARIIACSPDAAAHAKGALNVIAAQLALSADQRDAIDRRGAELLGSADVQARIAALRQAIQR